MKKKNFTRAIAASLMAAAMLAPTVANAVAIDDPVTQVLGETSFEEKVSPWQLVQTSPASQYFEIEDGALHVTINRGEGGDNEKWDLQLRHRNLNFKAGHTYEVSFKAKAKRKGMELCSQISTKNGEEYYFVLDGDEMINGPHMDGKWGVAAKLSTKYQTFKGTFTPTKDLEDVEWSFHYAEGTQYEGNAQDGDEIWFDDMSIVCTTCSEKDMSDCKYKETVTEDPVIPPATEAPTTPPATEAPTTPPVDIPEVVEGAQVLGETSFEEKIAPWQLVQTSPASQNYEIVDGQLHITVLNAQGGDKEAWDLQLRHRKLYFKKGHTYEVSFKAKSNRNGLQLASKIANIYGDVEYFVLDGDKMVDGPANDGDYGNGAELTNEYQTFKGTFTPTKDIEDAEWTFHYADGTEWGGNAIEGDELWFDDMSIVCTTCSENDMSDCKYKGTITEDPVTPPADDPIVVKEVQLLGETTFDYKGLPWHTVTQSPAKQSFAIEDGEYHIDILSAVGYDHEKWDLCFRHRNLDFKAGHTYEVRFSAKASRAGLELCSKIGNIQGDEEFFVLDEDEMIHGPHMDGKWGKAAILTTEYQTFSGIFKPTEDITDVEWTFQYADGTTYEGNAQDGDEIWFDDMSIICTSCDGSDNQCGYKENPRLLFTDRDSAAIQNPEQLMVDGKMVNYISVNQLGYMPRLAKIATFSDNAGAAVPDSSKIDLTEDKYNFELVDASTGKVVFEGVSSSKIKDKDSGDNVYKLDFSEYNTTGKYYLRIKGTNWRSFEFRIAGDIYSEANNDMLTNALNLYYQNRAGIDIEAKYITSGDSNALAHSGIHKIDTGIVQKVWNNYYTKTDATETYASSKIDVSGGWYNPENYNKYVVGSGMTVWTLQNMYERSIINGNDKEKFGDNSGVCVVPEVGNKVPDILEEVAYELDWMAKMKVQPDEPTWGEKAAGLYYHSVHDYRFVDVCSEFSNYRYEYECDPAPRIVKPPTFAATLNYAACAAQAARLWAPYDAEKAENYLKSAIEAYEAYEKYWYDYDDSAAIHPEMCTDCPKEELNETSQYAPMWQAKTGTPYADNEVKDDAYWAACEIFVSASEMGESETAKEYKAILSESDYALQVFSRLVTGESKDGEFTSLRWDQTSCAGSLSLALHEELLSDEEAEKVKESVLSAADDYVAMKERQGYGIPYCYDGAGYNEPNSLPPQIIINGYRYGSNGMAATNAIIMAYAYDITKDMSYINGVAQTMDYLLGNNPLSFSYITGYGTYGVQSPHHKHWVNEINKDAPKAPNGVLVGGASVELTDEYIRGLGFVPGDKNNLSQRCYTDSWEAWSVNDAALDWNASLAWVVSFLQDEVGTSPKPPVQEEIFGDANCDGVVSMADAASIFQSLGNSDKYGLSDIGAKNADVIDNGKGVTAADAIAIQAVSAKIIDEKAFPMTQAEYSVAVKK